MDKNMKILIVDDFSTMRRIIKNLLRDLGFTNTQEADDGLTALPMLKGGDFDFLVTDWNMPGMNGYELLKKAKEHDDYNKIPIMMVTTETEEENIVKAIRAGAANYLIKPFTMEEMMKKILECLGEC